MCVATVFAVGVLVGLVSWIVCWRIFLILCCFLLPSVIVAIVFAVGFQVGLVAWIVCWRVFLIPFSFLLPSVCGDFVCSGGSGSTGGLDCVLEDVSKTMLFSVALCVWRLCLTGGSSGTGGLDCVLEYFFITMLFSAS